MAIDQVQASDSELKSTLNNNSDRDVDLPTITRKAQKAKHWGRRGRQIILSDEEDNQNHTQLNTTPMTPTKKRDASEAYASPPSTKKRIRLSLSPNGKNKIEVVSVLDKPSEIKRDKKPRHIVLSKRNYVDNVYPMHNEVLTPQEHWDEKSFDLSSPRLVRPLPLRYTLVEEKNPMTGGPCDRAYVPDIPADDIKKVLFLNPKYTNIRLVGKWAERKLAEEIAKYDRVKRFWLFNYGYAYCPGWDCKHEFVAATFAEELQSPWVVAWLAELIGRKDVYTILDHLEWKMAKELREMEKLEEEAKLVEEEEE
ncbi:hypothetical protein VP1G_09577 [Cytospora mali]|uniref:Uncharacterized protein n=1 Tax=Cytospora mali TaxID=578113 RepID=A0A194VF13_CYTMA|nr:hypothetical protein VP1G_09577 [Valsa mali var. pyri (nom. inval.)]